MPKLKKQNMFYKQNTNDKKIHNIFLINDVRNKSYMYKNVFLTTLCFCLYVKIWHEFSSIGTPLLTVGKESIASFNSVYPLILV